MSRRRGSAGQGRSRALQRARLGKDTGRRAWKDEKPLRRLKPPQEGFELDAGKEFQAVSSYCKDLRGEDGDFGSEAPR